MRFVVYGAGAVGGVLGGHLARDKHAVLLICRDEHARVIREQNGLRMKSATGDYFAHLEAATTLDSSHVDDDTCVFFVPKSNDTPQCVEDLSRHAPADVPLVCFQNGVDNERLIAERFENVFGGVCRMTCSFLQPGQVSFRKFGKLVVGKYAKGAHPFAKKLGRHLESAGFKASVSNSIICDKWLKLVTNLQSGFHALVDERDHALPEFMQLKIGLLEEARCVLAKDRIRARSCDGTDASIDEMIDRLKKPRMQKAASSVRVRNSTWQNLYLKRDDVENRFFHEPIIALARKHAVPVPYNEVALELVTQSCRDGMGPGGFRAAEVTEIVRARKAVN